jgi:hypothetical protein
VMGSAVSGKLCFRMSCMSECSIAFCAIFTNCPGPRAHVIDTPLDSRAAIFSRSGRRNSDPER